MSNSVPVSAAATSAGALLAGDVAKQLGVGVQTLHFYEREGLIPAPQRTSAGYRLYTPELVERIAFVRKAQALGLPLDDVKEIVRLAERGSCPCGHVRQSLSNKLADVDSRMHELQRFRRELAKLIERSGRRRARPGTANICSIVEQAPLVQTDLLSVTPLARRPKARREEQSEESHPRRPPSR